MFENKKVLVLGMARSGYACCKTLVKLGCQVILNDNKDESKLDKDKLEELRSLKVKIVLGSHPDNLLDESVDYLVKNPGIRNDHKYVLKANELKIPVINEVEVGFNLLPKNVKLIAITGTNGKTTTTTLTYNIVKEYYKNTHLAGNIGYPLCSILDNIKEGDILVMEVSCQQLANLKTFNPNIALLTNLSPAHIDFFGDYETYKKVKIKLFQNQTKDDYAILNLENQDSLEYTKDIKSQKLYFSSKKEADSYLKDNDLYYHDEFIINRSDLIIKGIHNVENVLGAITISKLLGVPTDIIRKVLKDFRGVTHRLELVDVVNNRKFYNDTEATNIKCSQIALSAFPDNEIVLFLGGLERGQDFYELKDYLKKVRVIIGIGECRERVKEMANSLHIECHIFETLKEGFKKAIEVSHDDDIILLSPASASWDQYKECEERGDEFKELVGAYKNGSC